MVSDTDSTRTSNRQFQVLRVRLLTSYIGVVLAVLGVSLFTVYEVVAYNLNRQLNNHLFSLATSSAQAMGLIEHEYAELVADSEAGANGSLSPEELSQPLTLDRLKDAYGGPSLQLQLPENFASQPQGIEWYDNNRIPIVREGQLFADWPLPQRLSSARIVQKQGMRTMSLAATAIGENGEPFILGYVRVSYSIVALKAELRRLKWGLGLGFIVAAGVAALSTAWLTTQSLQPVVNSFDQLKRFTADAAHELRSPLTVVRGAIALIESHPERVHPNDLQTLLAAASASKQMSQSIDRMLLLARLDGQADLNTSEWRPVEVDEILEDTLALIEIEAQRRDIQLSTNLAPDIRVSGNPEQLKLLLANILENALQYTPANGTVDVSVSRSSQTAIIEIQDTGIGIAPDQLSSVFNRFWRADAARACRKHGSGLGLAIAKSIARVHEGKISVTSQLGTGTTFCITLPSPSSLYRDRAA